MLGPPSRLHPRPYPLVLEILESRANKKLTNEYKKETTQAWAHLESLQDINPSMIDLQPEIQWFMRPFLLDFIVELHSSFKLQPQTLFRCFNIVDRYCAKRIVFKRHYQLVGCTALWIAAKYEDKKSRVPTLRELALMCRNAYDEEMFVQMEKHILSTLEWSLGRPTLEECLQLSVEFCNDLTKNTTPFRYNKPAPIKTPTSSSTSSSAAAAAIASASGSGSSSSTTSAIIAISRFLCELSLYSRPFLEFETCQVAVTANMLACTMLQIPSASKAFQHISRKVKQHQQANLNKMDEDINEEEENTMPEVYGAFLCGFDDNTIYKIRKISLTFMQALNNITDVLSNKYKPLGVLAVVQNYVNKNISLLENLHGMTEEVNNFSSTQVTNTSLTCLADTFLSLNLPTISLTSISNNGAGTIESKANMHQPNNNYPTASNDILPVTPPSTSQSLFSDHNSSSSSIITPTTNNYKVNPFYSFSPAECAPVMEASPYYEKETR
ncbi:G1/S-specific cyclin Ccn1p [[Candida] railenensis]|uniref:G1/S-specific cyclin Ccn1p n=1 Tax=[Candida] railenensis TaxID=45579 RepID=A0A9P0QM41_9ASCO|nr:G1/S-specific cyclin Ccn1p [[Candida] railenensis]